jgi:exopolyphosphatase/guanosine-5'-triphosphate,3'-diphosphate pyrophosphatase
VTQIRAAIDLGTNTCLLLVAECEPKRVRRVLYDGSSVVRLGQGVDQSRMLQPEPMNRVLECLKAYAARVKELGLTPKDVRCVATSQARDAKNSQEFFERIRAETGFQFQTISGEQEARLTFLGSVLGVGEHHSASRVASRAGKNVGEALKHAVVIDIGGGSTELISMGEESSLDLGSVRFTERFFKSNSLRPEVPVTDAEFWSCQHAVDDQVVRWKAFKQRLPESPELVAVAGTATTLAAWHLDLRKFDVEKVDGTVLTRGDVHRMLEELKWRTTSERAQLPCMEPLRADVILAGALILWRTMEILDFPECRVSTRGLRYGAVLEV